MNGSSYSTEKFVELQEEPILPSQDEEINLVFDIDPACYEVNVWNSDNYDLYNAPFIEQKTVFYFFKVNHDTAN